MHPCITYIWYRDINRILLYDFFRLNDSLNKLNWKYIHLNMKHMYVSIQSSHKRLGNMHILQIKLYIDVDG
jgi:hypothetical protein